METRLRATPEQFTLLVDFMERNGDIARPQPGLQGRLRSDILWNEITKQLNSVGVKKSSDKWRKVWADWKTKTKKKYLMKRQYGQIMISIPNSKKYLTPLEKRVVGVMGSTGARPELDIPVQRIDTLLQPTQAKIIKIETYPLNESQSEEPAQLISSPDNSAPSSPLDPLLQATQVSTTPPPVEPPSEHQPSAPNSPGASSTSRRGRRRLLKVRRNRGQTPFDRATSAFVDVEQRRLDFEEARDRRLHEQEMERLRLESLRIQVTHEQNQLLQRLTDIAETFVQSITQPSTRTQTIYTLSETSE